MSRYEIVIDFKEKFIAENKNVWAQSLRSTYFSINGNEIKISTLPYSLENAEHGLVVYHYTYTAIERNYNCFVALFFNSNGEIENFIELDGWKVYFSKPITAINICKDMSFHITNGKLHLIIPLRDKWSIVYEFERIWQLFSITRNCKTQTEVNFLKKIYEQEREILSLKEKNLKDEAKIDSLNMLLESHKDLINKLKEIIQLKFEFKSD